MVLNPRSLPGQGVTRLPLGWAVFSSSPRSAGTVLPVPGSLDDCSHSVSLSPYGLFLTLALGEGRKGARWWFLLFLCLPLSARPITQSCPPGSFSQPLSFPLILPLPPAFLPLPPISLCSSHPLLGPAPHPTTVLS